MLLTCETKSVLEEDKELILNNHLTSNKSLVHVISGTHWDREWRFTAEQSLLRLAELIDELLDIMESNSDYKCFLLDGGTVVIEDYLNVRPENAGRLKELLHQRQLDISEHKLKVRVYPGHQGETLCNYCFITFPNGITVSHSGDQHNEDDFKWLSNIYRTVDTDILITNTWTLNPRRVCEGIKPKVLIPSHINEMQHTIDHREPYWKSYDLWGHYGDKVVRLIWGETYKYQK